MIGGVALLEADTLHPRSSWSFLRHGGERMSKLVVWSKRFPPFLPFSLFILSPIKNFYSPFILLSFFPPLLTDLLTCCSLIDIFFDLRFSFFFSSSCILSLLFFSLSHISSTHLCSRCLRFLYLSLHLSLYIQSLHCSFLTHSSSSSHLHKSTHCTHISILAIMNPVSAHHFFFFSFESSRFS